MFVGSGTLSLMAAWMADEGIADFLVDGRLPRTAGGVAANGRAERVEGGYRLTGRWPFASGSEHAEWLGGLAYVGESDPPVTLGFSFPKEQATLHGNWDVNALKGTGSQDMSVTDLFVPERHTYDNMAPSARGGPIYAITLPGFVTNEHGAFVLGAARRAIDETAELAKTKTRGYIVPRGVAARERFQSDLGRCDVTLTAARAGLIAASEQAWEAALAGRPVDAAMQAGMRSMAVHATEVSLEVRADDVPLRRRALAVRRQHRRPLPPRRHGRVPARDGQRGRLRGARPGAARHAGRPTPDLSTCDATSSSRAAARRFAAGSTHLGRRTGPWPRHRQAGG